MAFQTPITIRKALDNVHRNDYLLPAIQREVVWRSGQIERLFDSLMQGYPIGSFLLWKVKRENSRKYVFYEFLRSYHELNMKHLSRHHFSEDREITGVLDGQQRLTALNIGLYGSYATKLKGKWVNNPLAYPARYLYLNLAGPADGNELGMMYEFRFLTPDQVSSSNSTGSHWFKVPDIIDMRDTTDVFRYVQELGIANDPFAFPTLNRLFEVVNKDQVVNYFEEESQDLDKVLNIFIRVNSGGTELTYSDLLLSIATAQWKDIEAREVIHELVDQLNATGQGFKFNKDLVLKAGLMLTDIQSVAFRVINFNAANMSALERNWMKVASSLSIAVRLLSDFGFSDRTLTAGSVVIPVAYYLHKKGAKEGYLTSSQHRSDRELIRSWVVRSLVRSGVWGSGLDTLLLALRQVFREQGCSTFPAEELESAMALQGKSLKFDSVDVEQLLDLSYGDSRTFALMSLLYPEMNLRNEFHLDHIFPKSLFTKAKLVKAGVPEYEVDEYRDLADRLSNLQLLEGSTNVEKQSKLPEEWIDGFFSNATARASYRSRHHLEFLPNDLMEFPKFIETRRASLRDDICQLIGVSGHEM